MSIMGSAELFSIAKLASDLGHREFGISLLDYLLGHLPSHVAAHCLLGEELIAFERWGEAQEHFHSALGVCPLNLSALRGKVGVALAQGSDEEAETYARRAWVLYPLDLETRELLKDAPEDLSALSLARILAASGRHTEAVPYYEAAFDRVLDRPSEEPTVALLMAEALWKTGRSERARPLLETLVSREPTWVRPRLILADIALGEQEDSLGVALLHDASALDSSFLVARELLGHNERYRSLLQESVELPIPPAEILDRAPQVVRYLLEVSPLPEPLALPDLPLGELALSDATVRPRQKGGHASGQRQGVAEAAYLSLSGEQVDDRPAALKPEQAAPVRVILSSRERLVARYGEEGYRELDARLSDLREAAAESTGHEVIKVYVDDTACLEVHDLQSVDPRDPHQVHTLIQQLRSKLGRQSKKLASVLIVGGDSVIPLHRLPNPADDEDLDVVSDWPYAAPDSNPLLAQFSIGRLPDGPSADPEALLRVVESAVRNHNVSGENRARAKSGSWLGRIAKLLGSRGGAVSSVGYSAEIWAEASRAVFESIGDAESLKVSPPLTDYDFLSMYEELPSLAYFNLHGFQGSPYWYGHGESDHGSPLLPVALTPLAVSWSDAQAAVIYSEACYGAATGNGTVDGSIALTFLANGAVGFIGSTAMSYGSLEPPLSGADLLGNYLWEGVLGGLPIGCALRRARSAFIRAAASEQGYLDGEDQKALLSFVLYGDPSLSLYASQPSPDLEDEREVACPPITCRQRMLDSEPLSVSSDLQERVQRSLPSLPITGLRARRLVVCGGACSGAGCASQACPSEADRDAALPELIVTSRQKDVSKGGNHLQHIIKVTVTHEGDVTKVLMSRGGASMSCGDGPIQSSSSLEAG